MSNDIQRPSPTEMLILNTLISDGPSYGLKLVETSGGKIKRGSVYVLLGRMTDKGYVTSRCVEPKPGEQGPARRKYSVTKRGQRIAHAWSIFEAAMGGR